MQPNQNPQTTKTSETNDSNEPNTYRAYGQFQGNPTTGQLQAYFTLETRDRQLVRNCRTNNTKVGMAVQLCTLRFLGTFLEDLSLVPESVILHVQAELGLQNVDFKKYTNSNDARLDHRQLIVKHLSFREFEGAPFLRVARMLYTKLSLSNEATSVLIDAITTDLEQHNVVLPNITRISLLIGGVRKRVNLHLYRQITARISVRQKARLKRLFIVPRDPDVYKTELELLRTPPLSSSSITLQRALGRIQSIRDLGVSNVNLNDFAENRLETIVRHGLVVRPIDLEKYSPARWLATLLVLVQHLERSATDDALVVFDHVMKETGIRSQKRRREERLRTLKDLDAAALKLKDSLDQITLLLQDSKIEASQARVAVLAYLDTSPLIEAKLRVADLASRAEDEQAQIWENAHRAISPFLLSLVTIIKFEGTPAMKSLLEAITFLKRTSGKPQGSWGEPPRGFIPRTWLNMIFPKGKTSLMKRHHYLVCVAHQLHLALKCGDVFVRRSNRHDDPRANILSGLAWEAVKVDVLKALGLNVTSENMIKNWSKTLDRSYQNAMTNLNNHPNVRLETQTVRGVEKTELIITPYDELPDSPSLRALKSNVDSRLPEVDLSELLLEINARTKFAAQMVHGVAQTPHANGIELSVLAVLLAEACNIGLAAVSNERNPALTLSRLSWTKRHYVQSDTISHANVNLVEYHANLPITKRWGDGDVASADGIRFVVPIKTIDAGYNPKYFGTKRGITYYTLISDQFTQLHGQVIPGTVSDSLFILAALLEQKTILKPEEVMADTGAYSDAIFGLFSLLGYKFSPRIKDAGGSRYWRINSNTNYGDLNRVARSKINTNLIVEHWDNMLRFIGSIKLGKVKAMDAMRVIARNGSLNGLGNAIQEVGRIAKTLYLLDYVNDEATQRRVHLVLTHHETRHSLARALLHGKQGEIRQHYKKGMENQLGALGFVVNIIVLWNSLYSQAALELIEAMGDDVFAEDAARLSPLKWQHINLLGRYEFSIDPSVAGGDLRPLRDPNALWGLDTEP